MEKIKKVVSVLVGAVKYEEYERISGLQKNNNDLKVENDDLKVKNSELKKWFEDKSQMVFSDNMYIEITGNSRVNYCAACFDSRKDKIRLFTKTKSGEIYCPICHCVAVKGEIKSQYGITRIVDYV